MQKNVLSMPQVYEDESSKIEFMRGLKRIVPDRYIWHIKYSNLIEDISIAESGLIKGMHGMVFAHNYLTSFYDTYPYCIDIWDSVGYVPNEAKGARFSVFSYWRIDTKAFKTIWYIDPNMRQDCYSYNAGVPKNYICTDSDIPTYALKNFTFSSRRFEDRTPIIRSIHGASSYFSTENDFDTLVPNDIINGYMERQLRKAA